MLEFVIEAMVDAVVVVDADGRVSHANSGAELLSGYARDELRAMPVSDLFVDNSSGLRTLVRRRIEDGNVLRREDAWLLAKDGAQIPVSMTGSAVVSDKGALQGIVIVARDEREMRQLLADKEAEIQRRRVAEAELRAAKASAEERLQQTRTQLLAAERRATLGTLAGGVGHELSSIAQLQLAAVTILGSAMRAGEDVSMAAAQVFPELERVSQHIAQHGARLLQLARPGPDHVEPIDLSDVVRDVATMLKLAGKLGKIEIELALSPTPITCPVNRTRIEQILVNLITNAVDAVGETGTITVETVKTGDRAICHVRDTGTGIPADQLDKIFEPFYTTKGERGTGLGLPVVREIVASYVGSVTVTSVLGAGSTFTFDLPC